MQVAEHPLFALGVEEADALSFLVRPQARDELEAPVDGVDELAVVVGDRLADLADERIRFMSGPSLEFEVDRLAELTEDE